MLIPDELRFIIGKEVSNFDNPWRAWGRHLHYDPGPGKSSRLKGECGNLQLQQLLHRSVG